MSVFVVIALVLALATLVLAFAPLLRRHRGAGIALVVAGLAITGGLYTLVGTPAALDPENRTAPQTLADAISRLEKEMRRDPGQVEGWRLLADAYRAQSRFGDASNAFARAVELQPKDPDLLAQAAEARALAHPERRFDAQALALLARALEMDPAHQRAGWFLGVAQRQAGKPAEAARTWEALLARVDASTATALRTQIQAARADAGLPPLPPEASPGAATTGRITLRVDIDPALREGLASSTPVFVLARAPDGPPMPVAARRLTLGDLPADVQLTDGDSPMPTQKLSSLPRVEVQARVSKSGDATAAAGDLESAPVAMDVGTSATIRIDRVRP